MTGSPAPMLGDLLGAARRESGRFALWLESADEDLTRRIRERIGDREHLATYARTSVAAFTADAADPDWAHLVSATRDAVDPGLAVLGVMVRWRLAREAGP